MLKLHTQAGGRPYHFEDLKVIETAIHDALAASYQGKAFRISGCEVVGSTISPGMVFLNNKILTFQGLGSVTFPVYIIEGAPVNALSLEYETSGNAPVLKLHVAITSATEPAEGDWIRLSSGGIHDSSSGHGEVIGFNDGRLLNVSSIPSSRLFDAAITSSKIAANAILTTHLFNNSVTRPKIADQAINAIKIADDAVLAQHIANGALVQSHFSQYAVSRYAIAINAVGRDQIENGEIIKNLLNADVIQQTATPLFTLTTPWTHDVSARALKSFNNIVRLEGTIARTTSTASATAFTIPGGFRPTQTIKMPGRIFTSGAITDQIITISTGGAVSIPLNPLATTVYLDGINYYTAG